MVFSVSAAKTELAQPNNSARNISEFRTGKPVAGRNRRRFLKPALKQKRMTKSSCRVSWQHPRFTH